MIYKIIKVTQVSEAFIPTEAALTDVYKGVHLKKSSQIMVLSFCFNNNSSYKQYRHRGYFRGSDMGHLLCLQIRSRLEWPQLKGNSLITKNK